MYVYSARFQLCNQTMLISDIKGDTSDK